MGVMLPIPAFAEDGGKLVVKIPRVILDAKKLNNEDTLFMIFADENLIDQEVISEANGARSVSIQVPPGTESITISGTSAIPEFGPIARVILAISILSIVVITRNRYIR